MLILMTDTPKLSRVQSGIDPNKHDSWLQMRKWDDRHVDFFVDLTVTQWLRLGRRATMTDVLLQSGLW